MNDLIYPLTASLVPATLLLARRIADQVGRLIAALSTDRAARLDEMTDPTAPSRASEEIRGAGAHDPSYADASSYLDLPPTRPASLRLDVARREVEIDGRRVNLSRMELRAFRLLFEAHRSVRVDEIGEVVWGAGQFESMMVHQLLYRLRAKLEEAVDPDVEPPLLYVRGVGYILLALRPR